jgi:uncharacterized membrane protein
MTNYLAILVCGIIAMVVGYLWYSKMLFGKEWMRLSGITDKKMQDAKATMGKTYGIMFVASLIMAYVLSFFVSYAQATTLMAGVMIGFWAWFGFVATTMLTGSLFSGKSLKLYFIESGYQLVVLVINGGVLAIWH